MTPEQIATARNSRALSDIVRPYVKLKRVSRMLQGLCPFHKERTPSFYVNDLTNTYKCFGCGARGDAIDFLMHVRALDFPGAVKALAGDDWNTSRGAPAWAKKTSDTDIQEDEIRRIDHAHALWLQREPLSALPPALTSPAEAYLRGRGIRIELPDNLGYIAKAYCSITREQHPALMSPLQDRNGHVTAVQLVYLHHSGAPLLHDGKKIKRTFGSMRDGAVRLAMPFSTLGITGSVEDALSVMQRYSIPCWASCGETRLRSVWIPEDVEKVIVFADADDAGREQAIKAFHELRARRRDVEIVYPDGAKDFNAELLAS